MVTTYPLGLPDVPQDRWGAARLADRGMKVPDEGRPTAVVDFLITADTAEQAERRLFAYINHDFEDDLRGATATAVPASVPGRWKVTLRVPGEF